MIILKSPEEVARMRQAGRIVAAAVERLMEVVEPGMTTEDLDRIAADVIAAHGALPSFKGYRGFPATICTSLNDEVVHGIPSPKRKVIPGDVLKLDVGCIWEGYHGDSAVSVFVGGSPSAEAEKLVRVTEESLEAGIAALRPGHRLSDVGHAVQQVAEGAGFSCVREYAGHGVGRALHEDPQVPNSGEPGRGPLVKPGLVVAIEPMVNVGTWRTRVLRDHWTVVTADGSLSAHFEHTVAVTDDGTEVLTARGA
ncbi:MAG: type I methionyl aminopeptidase [Actinobacteria bacterium]|nr:MAG: type I methionyl aminopeptidase [Actinomycetota bacterium]